MKVEHAERKSLLAYNLSKRTFLYGTVGYVRNSGNANFSLEASPRDSAAGLSGSLTFKALADDSSAAPIHVFMTLSQALSAKSGLDCEVGTRLLAALQKSTPDLARQLPKLALALASNSAGAARQALALKIMEAWYLGTVDNE